MTNNIIKLTCGDLLNLDELDTKSFVLEDIAHSLSQMPTYLGRGKMQISHAQKAFYASWMLDPVKGKQALLTNAWVSYMGDIPSQIRKDSPNLEALKNKIQDGIGIKFNLPINFYKDEDVVNVYDKLNVILSTSILDYSITGAMSDGSMWNLDGKFHEWTWKNARSMFLSRFNDLKEPEISNVILQYS